MVSCPSCVAEQTESSKFCSECGAALWPEFAATVTLEAAAESQIPSSFSDASHHGQFLPGTKVANRYRIVSLIGKGGMGEVYRADDLKLGHTVALKFLPQDLADNPKRLEYFLTEVRLTRQISHPNVCRVYDIGEVVGQHFLSMEYIDGEDLRILLRRIGRLPEDKGLQIAQQLCAGLAAAHEKGVLHRDLKPANIMLDGRGQVRITDFGLAKLTVDETDEIAGTPAYMAPEQLTRGQTTIQSDLYALGLILYEVFTGQAARKSGSLPELIRANEESSLSQTLEMPEGINPTVGRAIARCLEKEPYNRPQSAHAVAASLPGGDPLAAALAAGETPSPEMVAAAGGAGTLSLPAASILLAILVVELIALVHFRGASSITRDVNYQAGTYAAEAHKTLKKLEVPGWESGEPSANEVYGFSLDVFPIDEQYKQSVLEFWYRDSESQLIPKNNSEDAIQNQTVVGPENPSPLTEGTVFLKLNQRQELRELIVRSSAGTQNKVDLLPDELDGRLFEAANLNLSLYQIDPDDPWRPALYAKDVRVYVPKSGQHPEPVEKVEIAASGGAVAYFRVLETRPEVAAPKDRWGAFWKHKRDLIYWVSMLITCAAVILAWKNTIRGKSDRRSAWRVAVLIFCLVFLKFRLEAGFTLFAIRQSFQLAAATAFLIWIYYLAIEPIARRIWPTILTDWTRAITGRWNDPSLGKGILIGAACGVLVTLLLELLNAPYSSPFSVQSLSGTRFQLSEAIGIFLKPGVFYGTYIIIFLVLFRVLVKTDWLAAVLTASLMIFFWHDQALFSPSTFMIVLIAYYGLITTLLIRFGVAATVSMMFCHHLGERFPLSADRLGPDVSTTAFVIVTILLLACYGFYTSVGGRAFFARLSAEGVR